MIKTHNKTGLKYLCKTIKTDYESYSGSGTRWTNHLKKHGRDFSTIVLFQTEEIELFKQECLRRSIEFDVVKSNEWANLILETGVEGQTEGFKHSETSKKLISENSAKIWLGTSGTWLGRHHSDETKKKISTVTKGKTKSDSHRLQMSKSRIGVKRNLDVISRQEYSQRMSDMLKKKITCSVCGKSGNAGNIARYHKECKIDIK